jgi:predicted dehydrogenase
MSIQRNIRFAVVGCGHIGKRHAEMVARNPEAELVALCDTADRSLLAIDSFNVPFFSSLDELLSSKLEIDVVCVCTPNGLHASQSIAILNNGKHVVCEKPMALTKADCEAVIFKSLQMSKQVFCVMQNRYSPPSIWIKNVVDNGNLGKIFSVQINCYWNRDDRYYTGKVGRACKHWMEAHSSPNSAISSTSCIGFLAISLIFKRSLQTLITLRPLILKIRDWCHLDSSTVGWAASTIPPVCGIEIWRVA